MERLLLITVLVLFGTVARAETLPPAPNSVPDQSAVLGQDGAPEGSSPEALAEARGKLLQKLSAKLLNHKGQPVSVVVFNPIDFTSAQVGPVVADTLVKSFRKYGNLSVRTESYALENLTLGEFRRGMAEFKVDVLVASSIRNTNFDLYIYDRRTPYFIYAHSEPIPEVTQLQINEEVGAYYARIMLRRALYRYINDQYFELPRQDSAPVLQSEIPRWIASPESLAQINREIVSNFYFSMNTGAVLARSTDHDGLSSTPMLALQIGYRLHGNLHAELTYENSAYNTLTTMFKYILVNHDSAYRIGLGLGAAVTTTHKALVQDPYRTLGYSTALAGMSLSVLFPIGDVYLKIENQNFIGFKSGRMMFTLMPGLLIHF